MKIYLDNCCLQRPLDDKSQLRIQLEAEEVDYFCSCDEKLIRRAKTLKVVRIKVVLPLELAEEVIE